MNETKKLKLMRCASALILLSLTLILIFITESRAIRSMSFANPALDATPSDDEMYQAPQPDADSDTVTEMILSADKKYDIDSGFIDFCVNDEHINSDGQLLSNIIYYMNSSGYRDDMWGELTGYSFSVLYDIYTGAVSVESGDPQITLIGDLYDKSTTTIAAVGIGSEGEGLLSDEVYALLRSADYHVLCGDLDAEGTEYIISGGMKIALCSADTQGGAFADMTKAAAACSDYVIAIADLSGAAAEDAVKAMIDAGADIVIGYGAGAESSFTLEYYGGSLIANVTAGAFDAGVLTVSISVETRAVYKLYPCALSDGELYLAVGDALTSIIEEINDLSSTASLSEKLRIEQK